MSLSQSMHHLKCKIKNKALKRFCLSGLPHGTLEESTASIVHLFLAQYLPPSLFVHRSNQLKAAFVKG
ncbi:hypothetical protein I7I48_07352 [Histoplasma ohiense]|nr:hypothetical protein I7I48_07352 [Histoplasma ohiense (nom. inval.)]